MRLKLDSTAAKAADNTASGIRESGKYIGTITRAELLTSRNTGTVGLGLGIKTADGQEANYLDLWHTKSDGTQLSSWKTVSAILCCAKVADAPEGEITIESWNNATKQREKVTVPGYPALMGKRIGLLLRKVLEADSEGRDRQKLEVFGVFEAESELTASELYSRRENPNIKPERLPRMIDALMAKPVNDKRKVHGRSRASDAADDYASSSMPPDDDIPF